MIKTHNATSECKGEFLAGINFADINRGDIISVHKGGFWIFGGKYLEAYITEKTDKKIRIVISDIPDKITVAEYESSSHENWLRICGRERIVKFSEDGDRYVDLLKELKDIRELRDIQGEL
jgi:hypothetical protein